MMLRLFCLILAIIPLTGSAEEILVAVANNFYLPMKHISRDYNELTGNKIVLSTGSSGQLYAQIANGAPFHVFLSADSERPAKLITAGLAVESLTYAHGKLVLWASKPQWLEGKLHGLSEDAVKHIAMANPTLAPYGLAAQTVLENLGLYPQVQSKLVVAKGLNPVYQFVYSGNAQLGFLALSQVQNQEGQYWLIPDDLYQPISQDAVLLKSAKDSRAARDFIHYLSGERARKLIRSFGYN